MEKQPLQYVPGTCNIGPEEIKKRVMGGWIGLAVAVLLNIALFYLHVAPIVRLLVFIPAFISALGFFQAGSHFCVAYGTKGLFNVSSEAGKTETVSQQVFRKKDQQMATKLIIYSVIVGIVAALLSVFI